MTPKARGVAQLAAVEGDVDPNLEDDTWLTAGFHQPDLDDAEVTAERSVFDGGNGSVLCTSVAQLSSMGVGMSLYLRLQRYLFCAFFLASIITLPTVLLCVGGERLTVAGGDSLGLAATNVGNLGFDPELLVTVNASTCGVSLLTGSGFLGIDKNDAGCNGTGFIHMAGTDWAYTLPDAGLVLSILDATASIVVFLIVLCFRRRIARISAWVNEDNVLVKDYAVFVKGLPRDVTEEEVAAHFSQLYDLRTLDWVFNGHTCWIGRKVRRRRLFFSPQLQQKAIQQVGRANANTAHILGRAGHVEPVLNATNTGQAHYLRSWVAEVSLAHPNGDLILRYQRLTTLITHIKRARASWKQAAEPYLSRLENPNQHPQELQRLWQTMQTSPDNPVRVGPRGRKRLEKRKARVVRLVERLESQNQDAAELYSEEVVGAFVTFNNEESWRRCVSDYGDSGTLVGTFCQPTPLRFVKGGNAHTLTVTPAAQPSDVLWENLEVGGGERGLRQFVSCTAVVLLLLASFAVLVLSSQGAADFAASVPSFATCLSDLPATAYGTENFPSGARLVRLEPAEMDVPATSFNDSGTGRSQGHFTISSDLAVGEECSSTDDIVLAFAANGKLGPRFYELAAEGTARLPQPGCFSPCVSKDGRDRRSPWDRSGSDGAGGDLIECTTLSGGAYSGSGRSDQMMACYCSQLLLDTVERSGVFGVRQALAQSGAEDICFSIAWKYGTSQLLTLVSSTLVVVINVLIALVVSFCTKYERHASVAAESRAIVLKVFISLFLNTAGLTLLANVNKYPGFTPGWYGTVGVSISITMAAYVVAPHVFTILACCRRSALCRATCSCREARARRQVLQSDVNRVYRRPEFEVLSKYPNLLTIFFTTLLYSGGIPILFPIAALAFAVHYCCDRYSIMRLARRPPVWDASLATLAADLMPYALLGHLLFTIWMYGDDSTFVARNINDSSADLTGNAVDSYTAVVNKSGGGTTLSSILTTEMVLPAVVLLLFVLLYIVVRYLCGGLVLRGVRRACFCLTCGRYCKAKAKEPGRSDVSADRPPFTAEFVLPLGERKVRLSRAEKRLGWRIERVRHAGGKPKTYRKVALWPRSGIRRGKYHQRGTPKLTWEVMAEYSIPSYDILAHPGYRAAVQALEGGKFRVEALYEAAQQRRAQEQMEELMRRRMMQSHARAVTQSHQMDQLWGGQPERERRDSRDSVMSVNSPMGAEAGDESQFQAAQQQIARRGVGGAGLWTGYDDDQAGSFYGKSLGSFYHKPGMQASPGRDDPAWTTGMASVPELGAAPEGGGGGGDDDGGDDEDGGDGGDGDGGENGDDDGGENDEGGHGEEGGHDPGATAAHIQLSGEQPGPAAAAAAAGGAAAGAAAATAPGLPPLQHRPLPPHHGTKISSSHMRASMSRKRRSMKKQSLSTRRLGTGMTGSFQLKDTEQPALPPDLLAWATENLEEGLEETGQLVEAGDGKVAHDAVAAAVASAASEEAHGTRPPELAAHDPARPDPEAQ